jgi:hypothetical protein
MQNAEICIVRHAKNDSALRAGRSKWRIGTGNRFATIVKCAFLKTGGKLSVVTTTPLPPP